MKVVVVGAGLSGLFTAAELVAGGVSDLTLVDAGREPGGITRTLRRGGYSLEPAAGSFSLPHPHLGPILERAGVEVAPAIDANVRHVFISGRLVTLSPSPAGLFSPILPVRAKLRVLAEPLVRSRSGHDETLAVFCMRRFGKRAGGLLAWLMASGVFAGDPEHLSVAAAFPALMRLEQEGGSVIRGALKRRRSGSPRPRVHVPVGGMDALADKLARSLGDRFRPGFPVDSVRRAGGRWVLEGPERLEADSVVLAVAPEDAARMVDVEPFYIARSPVAVVGLGGTGPPPSPGFGVLTGPDEGLVSLGILFESSYSPERAPIGSWLVKVIVGGARRPEVVDWDDQRLIDVIDDEVSRILGVDLEPSWVEVLRHQPGIPQYGVGHGRRLAGFEERLATEPGLYVTGWGYRGVGVANLASDAVRVAGLITE